LHLSVHFPFAESEVLENWDVLVPGDAFYSVFLPDTEWCYSPTLGLCFNQNLRWTDSLRAKWQVGFNDPYNGYYIGVGEAPMQYDDTARLRSLLPLNLSKQWSAMQMSIMDHAQSQGHLEECMDRLYSEEAIERENKYTQDFQRLSFEALLKLYQEDKSCMLYNRSIWFNTLHYEIHANDVMRLLRLKRYLNLET
jgi:hypothetical protein